ncbi:hypothetical protein LSPH24S_06829 [Lysinibacillus sphaericus]
MEELNYSPPLAVAMGISRFAFTPILPFMREDVGFSFEVAGFLASSNYIGYFIGALWAGFIYRQRKHFLLLSVVLNVISVVLMGLIELYSVWLVLRLIAGITGGLIFVLTSSIIMDYLAKQTLTKWSGYLFSGIGLGIAISGLFVPFIEARFAWQGTWIGLGILSALFLVITFLLWRNLQVHDSVKVTKTADAKMSRGFMPWLIAAYGFEGLGYIITGTFLVDIIHNIPSLQSYSSYSWVIVGVAAIPSAPVWTVLLEKFSAIKILFVAYILQVLGILLPVFSQTVWSVLLSSFLFGLPTITINICNFTLFEHTKNYHSIFQLYDNQDNLKMDDVLEIHFIDINRFIQQWYAKQLDSFKNVLDRWLMLLGMVDGRKQKVYEEIYLELEELAMKDEELFNAMNVWHDLSQSPEDYYAYQSRLKYILDEAAKLEDTKYIAEQEGLLKGIEQGIAQGIEQGIKHGEKKVQKEMELTPIGIDK